MAEEWKRQVYLVCEQQEVMHLATNTSYVRQKYRCRHIAAAEYIVPAAVVDSARMYSYVLL